MILTASMDTQAKIFFPKKFITRKLSQKPNKLNENLKLYANDNSQLIYFDEK